jgi:hypothetical protein
MADDRLRMSPPQRQGTAQIDEKPCLHVIPLVESIQATEMTVVRQGDESPSPESIHLWRGD